MKIPCLSRIAPLVALTLSLGSHLWAEDAPAPFTLSLPVAPGPFQGTMDSLTNYACPEWFRDAKFGIWAHWGPQAVPMEGDWYARKMYQQGTPDYKDHLARWGHPSTNGWKDIIPLWKAENWEYVLPEELEKRQSKATGVPTMEEMLAIWEGGRSRRRAQREHG